MKTKSYIVVCILLFVLTACEKQQVETQSASTAPVVLTKMSDEVDKKNIVIFNKPDYPSFIKEVVGVSGVEPNGRWTDGPAAVFTLKEPVQGTVNVEISGQPYGPNSGKVFKIVLGEQTENATFGGKTSDFETVSVQFVLQKPSNTLKILVPEPTVPPGGDRKLGLFLNYLNIR